MKNSEIFGFIENFPKSEKMGKTLNFPSTYGKSDDYALSFVVKMSWWGGNSIPAPIVYDELPTPITDEDYKKVARDALADSLALEDDPGWSQLKFNDPNVQLYELNDPDSAIKYVKISTELPASPKEIYQFVTDDRMEQRLLWDKELIEIRVIKSKTHYPHMQIQLINYKKYKTEVEDIDVIYQAYKAPYPVTNRNFVAIRGHTTLEG